MSHYQTLEQRFLEKSSQIYSRFSNTSATNPEIKPDTRASRSRIKDDNRSLPIVSTQRDVSRIFNFLKSRNGVLFLSKQLLLQTGNVFAETRLFNPLEIGINSIPFLHATRHLGKPIGNLFSPTRDARGALQQETINSFDIKDSNAFTKLVNRVTSAAIAPFKALLIAPKPTPDGQFYMRPEDNNNWFPRLLESQPLTARGTKWQNKAYKNSGLLLARGYTNTDTYTLNLYIDTLRPKINVFPTLTEQRTGAYNTYLSAITKNTNVGFKLDIRRSKLVRTKTGRLVQPQTTLPNADTLEIASAYNDAHIVNTPDQRDITLQGVATHFKGQLGDYTDPAFFYQESIGNGNGYFAGPVFDTAIGNANGENIKQINQNGNVKDPYNLFSPALSPQNEIENLKKNYVEYSSIAGKKEDKSDIIKFIFKSNEANADPIHFRALLSAIRENIKPEYTEQRYIGRTERFVTYAGAKRTVGLEFNIVAFSKAELDNMWLRINYLTGLAFPRGASDSGFMVPPLFKVTIGGIYEDQPCYLDTLDYDFLDNTLTFDIDKEVSQVINVKMNLTLLEKRSRFYNSPFYKVMEQLSEAKLNNTSDLVAEIPNLENFTVPEATLQAIDALINENTYVSVINNALNYSFQVRSVSDYVRQSDAKAAQPTLRGAAYLNNIVGTTITDAEIKKKDEFLAKKLYSITQTVYGTQPIPLDVFCLGSGLDSEMCGDIYTNRYLPLFQNGTRVALDGPQVGPPAP